MKTQPQELEQPDPPPPQDLEQPDPAPPQGPWSSRIPIAAGAGGSRRNRPLTAPSQLRDPSLGRAL